MENLGSLAVLLAFCLAVYAIIGSVVGRLKRNPFLILSAERAVYSVWFLITVASGVLIYALVTGDFRYSYVAQYSNRAMSGAYKFSAWWGGQEGSLLLWSWLLATYSSVAIFTNRRKLRDVMPYVTAILMTTQTFFLILNAFVVSPFRMLAADGAITAVPDGNGLNPLLQYPMMRIHPPMLYLGYVGMVVPFAFAMGSLITRQKGDAWIFTTRRWSLVTWLFQGVGVLMGASWAYAALGWGGYWAWDPVENASLLPWLSSTAFLHSVMMQEKKGMMKVWNVWLIFITFMLSILGTLLTRSGVVSSVHSFAQSSIGTWFAGSMGWMGTPWRSIPYFYPGFLEVILFVCLFFYIKNRAHLRSENQLEALVSRESSFLFNNLLFTGACFAVLYGTLLPIFSEWLRGYKITVGAPWF